MAIILLLPLVISFPALLVAAFHVHIALGGGLLVSGFVGLMVLGKFNEDYPSLDNETSPIVGFSFLFVWLAATISGMVWGTEGAHGFWFMLFAMIYGGFGLATLTSLLILIPWSIRLSMNRKALIKRIKSVPLDNALSLADAAAKTGIKKTKWTVANIKKLAQSGNILPTDAEKRYVQISMGEKTFVVYNGESIISSRGYTMLKERAENYLLQNGPRTFEELEKEVTTNVYNQHYMVSTLDESVGEGIVCVKSFGPNLQKIVEKSAEKASARAAARKSVSYWDRMLGKSVEPEPTELELTPEEEEAGRVFEHKQKPMITNTIDLDELDD